MPAAVRHVWGQSPENAALLHLARHSRPTTSATASVAAEEAAHRRTGQVRLTRELTRHDSSRLQHMNDSIL